MTDSSLTLPPDGRERLDGYLDDVERVLSALDRPEAYA
jgi:hypothetical protein